jgi:hypothetical protein
LPDEVRDIKYHRVTYPVSSTEWLGFLEKLQSGDHRASLVSATGARLSEFYNSLEDKHFADAARIIRSIALNDENTLRTKIRAVQAALSPIEKCTLMLPRLLRDGHNAAAEKLARRMTAYMNAWKPGDFAKFAKVLINSCKEADASDWDRIRAIDAMIGSSLEVLNIVLQLQQQVDAMKSHTDVIDKDLEILADAEMDEMIATAEWRYQRALEIGQNEEMGTHGAGDESAGGTGSGEGMGPRQQEVPARQEEVSEIEEVING